MKKIAALLCLIIFSNSAFAVQNYTYTRVEEDQYSASSPVGYFEEYNSLNTPVYVDNNGFQNVNYISHEPSSASIQDIRTPQSYNKRKIVTESMRDDREKADKVIERVGTVGVTLGILGLITTGILAIIDVI